MMNNETKRRKIDPLWAVIIVMPLVSVVAALGVLVLTSDSPTPITAPQAFTPIPITTDHALEGEPAPNFELARLDGDGTIRLSSLRGRMVFVNFWATWCEPCRRELPALQAFSQREQASNAPLILAVNIGETPEQIAPFFDELGINDLTVLLDTNWGVSDLYQTEVYPSTFVIDSAGTVVDFHLGELTLADLEGYVAEHGT